MELDLRAVRSFVELSRDLSFTSAALRLHITQPQLSLRIKNLESQIGFRLFERTSRSVRLTKEGAQLLSHAKRLLQNAESLERHAEGIRFKTGHTLRIGVVEYFQPVRRRLLKTYMTQNPRVAVEIDTVKSAADGISALAGGELDAVFLLQAPPHPPARKFESILLARQTAGLLVKTDSRLAAKPVLDGLDVEGLEVGLFRRELQPALYDEFMEHFASSRAQVVRLPEPTEDGLLDFVRTRGTPAACVRWWQTDEDAPPGLTHRAFRTHTLDVGCILVRARGRASAASNALWRLAQDSQITA
jgi:DNA-binding transcriptional LysR family regulator